MSEIKQRKKTSLSPAFMNYGLTLIALGAFVLIEEIDYRDFGGGSIESILSTLATVFVPSAFVLKLKGKKTLSIAFAILATVITVFHAIPDLGRAYDGLQLFQIIAYLFLHLLLVLFVALPEIPIKSFFPFFPVVVYLVMVSFNSRHRISIDILFFYILGFSMTTPMATNFCKPVKKNAGVALEKLESLAKLKEQGILTNEEFETKKAEIMQIM